MDNQTAVTKEEFLKHAIMDGDTIKVLQLLQQNDVNLAAVDENGDTVLHVILQSDPLRFSHTKMIEMMDIFISRGVDPNIQNKHQETALHLAIAEQLKDVVDYLLKHKSNIKVIDDNGNSIAHHFVKKSCEKFRRNPPFRKTPHSPNSDYVEKAKKDGSSFVEWLLSRGVDFDLKNKEGQSALHLAMKYNLQHILWTLIKNTRDIHFVIEVKKGNLLHLFLKAIYVNNRKPGIMVSYDATFPPQQTEVNAQKFRCETISSYPYPLHCSNFPPTFAVEIVQIMLERGVSVDHEDKDGLTPLHLAIRNKIPTAIVDMIFDRFANVSDKHAVTLVYEVLKNKLSIDYLKFIEALIAKDVNVNGKDANGKTCVYHAVVYDDLKAVELLQKSGPLDFHLLTNKGENLLHAFAERGLHTYRYKNPPDSDRVAIFDLLISEGCDIHAKNYNGQTPLHWAARYSNAAVAKILIAHGAEINFQDYEKQFGPLHEAISQGSVELAELLLINGANVSSKSMDGRPLHLATKFSTKHKLAVLLKYKAEVNARDHEGDTAFAKALRFHCGQNYQYPHHFSYVYGGVQELLENGADINDTSVIRVLPRCANHLVGRVLLEHWIKLKTADLYCSKEYQTCMHQEYQTYMNQEYRTREFVRDKYEKIREDCLREVAILRNTFIASRTSLYDWLHMHSNRRHIYNLNENLQKIVDSTTIKERFPQYSTEILGNYRETLTRKSLVEPAKEAWLQWTEIYLPDICLERIFIYLNTGDMFEMAETLNESVHSALRSSNNKS